MKNLIRQILDIRCGIDISVNIEPALGVGATYSAVHIFKQARLGVESIQ